MAIWWREQLPQADDILTMLSHTRAWSPHKCYHSREWIWPFQKAVFIMVEFNVTHPFSGMMTSHNRGYFEAWLTEKKYVELKLMGKIK